MNTNQPVRGFTLVEIAVAIIIIGILIGGIIKGHEMIEAARVKSILKNIAGIQQAHQTFRGKYNFFAGDLSTALTSIPNCTAANFCANGNGDMIIGATTTDFANNDQAGTASLPDVETTMYWKHLAISDLLSGINVSANPTAPAWNDTHPSCAGCGGYHIMHITNTAAIDSPGTGHYLLIRDAVMGNPNPVTQASGSMTPLWALEIDNKIDDGKADAGYVRAPQAGGRCSDATGIYNTSNKDKDCILLIKL